MKMQRKYVIRRRVVFAPFVIVGLVALYYIVNHVWWTGSGWCLGSAQKCIGL